MNNAILIQHCLSTNAATGNWSGIFNDMLRLTQQRHLSYTRAHKFDYWAMFGDIHPEMFPGAWGKVWLTLSALRYGYEYAVWFDTDAAVTDMSRDLRDALPAGKFIGAVKHDAEWLRKLDVKPHFNVGVLYVRNSPLSIEFFEDWLKAYPGPERWMDQGAFNVLIESEKYRDLFSQVDDTWNATINVNMVAKPAVSGWHGVMPPEARLEIMRQTFKDDFLKFRV